MKTNTAHREVTTTSVESSNFTISNNAKIFKILIDGLYTNKIQSITREIWSNALDSHVQAGCEERPFDVSLPSVFDPTFRVRDYGVGLDHDMVMHLYTDLGNSTKEDTNAAIGKFGIGSKSPFAYTDNFTVTSWFGGEKRYYSAMIGSDGVPGIHLLGVESTDEENGIEVAFPVHARDTRSFADAARRVSYGFDVKPNVVNGDFDGWPEMNVTAAGEGWVLLNKELGGHRQQAYARMGPVLYPIDVNALTEPNQKVRDILAASFVIDFPMGDLEITASREDLSYGHREPTGDAIKARAEKIYDEIVGKFRESYAECSTYFDACCKYREDIHNGSLPQSIKSLLTKEALFGGEQLKATITLKGYRGLEMSVLVSKLRNKTFRHIYDSVPDIQADRNTVVFVEDMRVKPYPKAVARRLREYYLENKDDINQIIWIRSYRSEAEESFKQFMEDFDGVPFISEEDLPEYATNRSGGGHSGRRAPVKARQLSRYDSKFKHKVELSKEDFDEGGIYIPLERMQFTDWNLPVYPHNLFKLMGDLGLINQPVIGAPKSMIKRFEGDQWIEFQAYAKTKLDELDIDFAAEDEIDAAHDATRNEILRLAHDLVKGEHADTPLLKHAYDMVEEAKSHDSIDLAKYRQFYDYLNVPLPEAREVRDWQGDVDAVVADLESAYPLLGFIATERTSYNNPIDIVGDYVIMCDTMQDQNHIAAIAAE